MQKLYERLTRLHETFDRATTAKAIKQAEQSGSLWKTELYMLQAHRRQRLHMLKRWVPCAVSGTGRRLEAQTLTMQHSRLERVSEALHAEIVNLLKASS